ncbi:hypothetical protein D3C80_1579210 [compost metagenome]
MLLWSSIIQRHHAGQPECCKSMNREVLTGVTGGLAVNWATWIPATHVAYDAVQIHVSAGEATGGIQEFGGDHAANSNKLTAIGQVNVRKHDFLQHMQYRSAFD